jgi:hypothetical protein
MIKAQIILYAIVLDKPSQEYQILSDHPDRLVYCSKILKSDIEFSHQLNELFIDYLNFDIDFVNTINVEPFIEETILNIPIFCIVPYTIELKKGHFIPVKPYVYSIPTLRKILNLI